MKAATVTLLLAVAFPLTAASQVAQPTAPSRAEVIAAAKDIMQAARFATLITIGEDGQPEARVVDPFLPEADVTVWMATIRLTRKVGQIRRDPRVTLLYFNAARAEYVTVLGTATLVTDAAEKASHWKEEWANYFTGGPGGEDYVLIRVRPTRLEVVSPGRGLAPDPSTWRPIMVDMR